MIEAKIERDSVNPAGERITTFVLSYPVGLIHQQLLTHRVFARNTASTRAVPTEKLIAQVRADPAMPVMFGKNKPGMQADGVLDLERLRMAQDAWVTGAFQAARVAEYLNSLGVHKEIANRPLAPYLMTSTVLTGTDFSGFFSQRVHDHAQPDIRRLAVKMLDQYVQHDPIEVEWGGWHLPFVSDPDDPNAPKIATARAARVSYFRHLEERTVEEDIKLHDKLLRDDHMSPFEHAACATMYSPGAFDRWTPYRHMVKPRLRGRWSERKDEYDHMLKRAKSEGW